MALAFEFRSFAEELALCQRYCNAILQYGTGNTTANRIYCSSYAGTNGFVNHSIPRMREEPTITYTISGGTIYADYSSNDRISMYDNGDDNFYV